MSDEVVKDDAYYAQLGRDAEYAGGVAAGVKPLAFGPMQPVQAPAPAPAPSQEDAIVARILAALGKSPEAPTQPMAPVSKEDQRVLDVMARLFPTGRDARVKQRYTVGQHLYVVEIAYTPNTGTRRDTEALVFDNGDKIYVFGAD